MTFRAPSPQSLFLIQILATAMMTGIIWFVQVVHYPLFPRIPSDGFVAYEQSHTLRTGLVVAPLMIVELATALLLVLLSLPGVTPGNWDFPIVRSPLYLAALGCLILIWVSTFLIQVPLHGILERTPDEKTMALLVATNWIRTILWSIRLVFLGVLLAGRFAV